MKLILPLACLMVMTMACNQSGSVNQVFNTSKLDTESFTIDVTKETKLTTRKGATILIPAGSIDAGKEKTVDLEVEEAYSMQDIVKAGLPTISDGQPLSSGGMICIRPARSSKASVKKPLYVSIPSPTIEPGMDLYIGEEKNGAVVNWKKSDKELLNNFPASFNQDTVLPKEMLELGKNLFENNCATCHAIDKDLTGPALAWASTKMKAIDPEHPRMLYNFTRNNQQLLSEGNLYYTQLFQKWKQTPMNVFPLYTTQNLDALYGYIENESKLRNLPVPPLATDCIDSCIINIMKAGYKSTRLNGRIIYYHPEDKDPNILKLVAQSESINSVNRTLYSAFVDTSLSSIPSIVDSISEFNDSNLVLFNNDDKYYLPVLEWGWYNVDQLVENLEGSKEMEVSLTFEDQPQDQKIEAILFIPALRVNIQGYQLGTTFKFPYNKPIKVIPGYKAFIIVYSTDTAKHFAAHTEFIIQDKHHLKLKLQSSTVQQTESFLANISKEIFRAPEQKQKLVPEQQQEKPTKANTKADKISNDYLGYQLTFGYRTGDERIFYFRKIEDKHLCSCLTSP